MFLNDAVIILSLITVGDALVLAMTFGLVFNHYNILMYEIVSDLIIHTNIRDLNIKGYLGNKEEITKTSADFSKISEGMLNGAISGLDR